jgi:excisionase family DNA binding protein
MAGWRPLPRKRPPARHNGLTFQVRRRGYRTLGEVADASGVPNTTLRRWIDRGKLPAPPLQEGLMAVSEDEFEAYVARCRALYLSAPKTRNKDRAQAGRATESRPSSGQGA